MGKKVLFLVSGNGVTLKFLYKAIQEMNLSFSIVGVLADRDCGALNFAKEKKIPYQKIIYNSYKTDELVPAIKRFQPDIIITTFHKIVDSVTLQKFSNINFINVHYSLLPDFAGMIGFETLTKAKELHKKKVGVTVHFVDEKVDAGKIISQAEIKIDSWQNVDEEKLRNIIFKSSCILLLDAIFSLGIEHNQLKKNENYFDDEFKINFKPLSNKAFLDYKKIKSIFN